MERALLRKAWRSASPSMAARRTNAQGSSALPVSMRRLRMRDWVSGRIVILGFELGLAARSYSESSL
jgi:hypothetical protein